MIQLPNNEKCYSLPEQVAQNLLNIKYLAEQYANIDSLPAEWRAYKDQFDEDFDTFGDWTTTFEGWDTTLSTYLANMSSAAVSAIAGQNIAPANVTATGNITAPSIIENTPAGISFTKVSSDADANRTYVYASFCKNGNKITVVNALNVERLQTVSSYREYIELGTFTLPSAIADLIYPAYIDGAFGGVVGVVSVQASTTNTYFKTVNILIAKQGGVNLKFYLLGANTLDANTVYYLRGEVTLLLSANYAS